MRTDDVPQDNSSTYAGHKKLLYAQNEQGHYQSVQSNGWQVEAEATLDAVALYERLAREAWQLVKAGDKSPLYFYMYHSRMDEALLAQVAGVWRWCLRRHFKPTVFARLTPKILSRYAQAMDLSVEQLTQLPDTQP
ncbi:hypothetical protein [Gilvimarinus chinensis]|uniref:hypothetical protein n=1 Tax=Gilvimarinus chinensis TaxID=396005 RepID=UPI00035F60C7|nr:hypothetical protein [Gilvimarinus chinensis]